jgi:hypothetical protein
VLVPQKSGVQSAERPARAAAIATVDPLDPDPATITSSCWLITFPPNVNNSIATKRSIVPIQFILMSVTSN